MPVLLSAVIVAFRSADHLPGVIGDLAAQGVEDIVVVDNASPDDSAAVAAAASPLVRVLRMQRNGGFAAGVNAGMAAAQGVSVLLVNPDVRLEPGCIAALRAAARRHPEAVLGPIVRDRSGRVLPTRRSLPSLWNLLGEEVLIRESAAPGRWPQRLWARWRRYDREVDAPVLSGVCLLVPRVAWQRTGPMDEAYFLYWEEVDWQLRARRQGHPTVLVPDAVLVHARSASLGLHDPARARLLAQATRRHLSAHLRPRARALAAALLLAGQAARWLAWALPALRTRAPAAQRRAQHAAWIRGFRSSGGAA